MAINPFVGYEQDDPIDSAHYARMVGNGLAAARILEPLADEGNPVALHLLADLYDLAEGVPRDTARAAELREEAFIRCRIAAAAGQLDAQLHLWQMYGSGRGVERDLVEAGRWRRAALNGLRDVAERGDGQAQHRLALLYWDGAGVKQDRLEAEDWYRRAFKTLCSRAEQGSGEAQYAVATLYLSGRGVERDRERASSWFRRAAEHGNPNTIYRAGGLFFEGRGRRRGRNAEVARLKEAGAAGCAVASQRLGLLCWDGTKDGTARSRARAAAWFGKAAEAGAAPSQFMLGRLHLHGVNGPADLDEASRWILLAQGPGPDVFSREDYRRLLYAAGHGAPKDVLQAYRWWEDFRVPIIAARLRFHPIVLPSDSTPTERKMLEAVDPEETSRRLHIFILKTCRDSVPRNSRFDFVVELLGDAWRDDRSQRERLARKLLELLPAEPPEHLPQWVIDGVIQAMPYFHRIAWRAQQQAEEIAFVRSAVGSVAVGRDPVREEGFLSTVRTALSERMTGLRENILAYRHHYEEILSKPPANLSAAELEALGTAWIVIGCAFVALLPERNYRSEYWLGWQHCEPGWAKRAIEDGALSQPQFDAVIRAHKFSQSSEALPRQEIPADGHER